MSHKLYRMCLLSVVILAIVGGIFYYLNYVKDETDITDGTLVRNEQRMESRRERKAQEEDNRYLFQEDEEKAKGKNA